MKEVSNIAKQVMFMDLENEETHGGILLDNGDLICAECGGLFEADENGVTWKIKTVFEDWIDLDEEICGDEIYDIMS